MRSNAWSAVAFVLLATSGNAVAGGDATAVAPACSAPAAGMARTELLFGAAYNNGKPIGRAQWSAFLAREVTPRFPDGLTAFDGTGQWKGPSGVIEKSPSRVLLLWYAPGADASARIDAIRDAYKKQFHQLSVMRVDGMDCVSF